MVVPIIYPFANKTILTPAPSAVVPVMVVVEVKIGVVEITGEEDVVVDPSLHPTSPVARSIHTQTGGEGH